jgi:hypothetical protein
MIHSFTVTFGVKYLTGMVTSVPPYETFSLINFFLFLRQSKIYKKIYKYRISDDEGASFRVEVLPRSQSFTPRFYKSALYFY